MEHRTIALGCGGRDCVVEIAEYAWIARMLGILNVVELIDGGAPGADTIFHRLAIHEGIGSVRFFPNWKRWGKRAGPIRNATQLQYLLWRADTLGVTPFVCALPGGTGTADMVRQARAYDVRVIILAHATMNGILPQSREDLVDAHLL